MRRVRFPVLLALCLSLSFAACGDDGGSAGPQNDAAQPSAAFEAAIRQARDVEASDFPSARGKSLEQLAAKLPKINVGLATSVFTPGENRLGFGVIDQKQSFIYGKTAVYLARTPTSEVLGPFPAPADPLVVDAPFRSQGAAEETADIAAIYETQVNLPSPGRWYLLAMTKVRGKTYGAAGELKVATSSPIPDVGEPAPKVKTDTLVDSGGDIKSIDTRVPPDDMHDTDLRDVIGKKPVALLFATPALCESRVCGPVVDIAAQLKKKYGDRVAFIHQEVFVDNMTDKGLRPPLKAFELQTEPWLFTLDAEGRVAARLEGSFGNGAFERAIKAAL